MQSVSELEQKQKTLEAENQCLRERRGGPIAQNGYRQKVGFWDGDLKRTVPGIDVVPIYCVDRSGVTQSGYFCVGIPDHVIKAATVYPTNNGHALPPQQRVSEVNFTHSSMARTDAMGRI